MTTLQRIAVSMVLSVAPVIASGDCGATGVPQYGQFTAGNVYRGKVHPPALRTQFQRKFRTRIRLAIEDGVNFGGHYVLATWGCGTGCVQFVVIDAITGTVYEPPFDASYFHYPLAVAKKWPDYEPQDKWWCDDYADSPAFKLDSNLLVVEGCIAANQCGRTYFVMTPSKLKQIHFDPDLSPDGTVAPP